MNDMNEPGETLSLKVIEWLEDHPDPWRVPSSDVRQPIRRKRPRTPDWRADPYVLLGLR